MWLSQSGVLAAKALGTACGFMEPEELAATLNEFVLAPSVDEDGVLVDSGIRLSRVMCLNALLTYVCLIATAHGRSLVSDLWSGRCLQGEG